MRKHTFVAAAAVLLASTLATAPVLAQPGSESRRSRERGGVRPSEGGSRVEAPDRGNRGEGADRGGRSGNDGREVAVRRSEVRPDVDRDRNDGRGANNGRRDDDWRDRGGYNGRRDDDWRDRGGYNDRRDDRWRDSRRYDDRYDSRYGYDGRGRYGSYNRDAWRGRVRFGLGVSIFAGSPFRFHFDVGWRPRFNYYYPMRAGLAYGGMAFLLEPDWAEVYIDGQFVGIARDFGGQPVPVAAGFHRIELYAPGFEPAAFDVHVLPGQVIPYRGSLYDGYNYGGYNYGGRW